MKVLHVLHSNKISGAENVVADICMIFKDEYEMMYCSPDGLIRQALVDRNVNYFPLKRLTFREIHHAIKNFRPDIIHAHDVRATVITGCVSGRIPIISHLHGNAEDMRKLGLKSFLYLLATKKVKKVITVSESCCSGYIFRKQIEKKTICLKNIVYKPRIEKLTGKDHNNYNFDFVYVGRLSFPKNPRRIAKVASSVLKHCPTATFGVIGEGELKNEMDIVFQNEGVVDRVVFTGNLSYPYKALKQAKCLLMCSIFEGTPITALEAMALGVPIVSTPVDGMIDLVDNGITGYLSTDDDVLAGAVQELITDSIKQKKMSDNSFSRFKSLNNITQYKEQLKDIYLGF